MVEEDEDEQEAVRVGVQPCQACPFTNIRQDHQKAIRNALRSRSGLLAAYQLCAD